MRQIERGQVKLAAIVAILCLIAAVVFYLMSAHLSAGLPGQFVTQTANHLLLAGLIAALSAFHAQTARLAAQEAAEAAAKPKEQDLFGESLDAGQRRERALQHFQKGIVPVVLFAFSVVEAILAINVLRALAKLGEISLRDVNVGPLLPVAATSAALGLGLFFLGKFCAGAAFGERHAFLRPVAACALGLAAICAGSTVAAILLFYGFESWARLWAAILAWLALVLASERILVWWMDLYRPKRADDELRPVYESRLLGLFSQPHGPLATLSEVVAYQFGFSLDSRSISRFIQRLLLPFVALQLAVFVLLSCLVYVRPHEQGLVEGWQKGSYELLAPGLHLRAPWPVSKVTRVEVERVTSQEVGAGQKRATPLLEAVEGVQQWADSPNSFALCGTGEANTANLMDCTVAVAMRPANAQQYQTGFSKPELAQAALAQRALTRYLLQHNMVDQLEGDISQMENWLTLTLADWSQQLQTGVVTDQVSIQRLQPPADVAAEFDTVLRAQQATLQQVAAARRDAAQATEEARAESNRLVQDAKADTVRTTELARVEVENFSRQLAAYRKHPELYRTREHLALLERWLKDVNKLVLAKRSLREVISVDLKEQTDLLGPLEE